MAKGPERFNLEATKPPWTQLDIRADTIRHILESEEAHNLRADKDQRSGHVLHSLPDRLVPAGFVRPSAFMPKA